MGKVPLICFLSGYIVLLYSFFLHNSFFETCNFCYCLWTLLIVLYFICNGYARICLIYYLLLNRTGMLPILYGMYYCLCSHMMALSSFLSPILNIYWAHGLLEALIPHWGRCCLPVYLLCCWCSAGFDKVRNATLAPDELLLFLWPLV